MTATSIRTTSTREAVGARREPLLHRPLTSYYLVLGSAGLLMAIGLVMVLSASSVTAYTQTGSSFTFFDKQLFGVALGLPVMWVAMRLPPRAFRALSYPLLLASLGLLALVLVPGVGRNVYGATRWIDLGLIQIQPSEPAKLALALWGADLLTRKSALLGQYRHLLIPLVPVTSLLGALVMLEPDMGTTIVLLAITLGLLWVVGAPGRLFGGMSIAVVGLSVVMIVVEPYRLQRITGFLNPWANAQGAGWQGTQGLLAIASGGWWGLGLGASRQKWSYLPNQYTDYIFAIIGEELGLIGTLVIVALFATLGYAGIRIARRSGDPFVRLAATAATVWLLSQAIVNMGAVVGLLPITGIPLPMVSYGGSALIPTMFAVGMLAAFARLEPGAAEALALRRRTGRTARTVARFTRRPLPAAEVAAGPLRPRPARRRGRPRRSVAGGR